MKKIFFILLIPITIGIVSCSSPTAPVTSPPSNSSPVVFTRSAVTTTTTAVLIGYINPNGGTVSSIKFMYGLTEKYGTTVDAVPSSVSGNSFITVTANIEGLSLGTSYHCRVWGISGGAEFYGNDSVFTTESKLKVGDHVDNGIVIYVDNNGQNKHGLLAAVVDQTDSTKGANFLQAPQLCANYGYGYRLPDSAELRQVRDARDAGILGNFVTIGVTVYLSSTENKGSGWIFCLEFNKEDKFYNVYPEIEKTGYLNIRAVKSF